MMFLLILWFIFQKDKERMQGINFIAIDFETATGKRASICEAGICVVKDSKVVETKSWLVRPEDNQYNFWNNRQTSLGTC